jgi:hypothetical protein
VFYPMLFALHDCRWGRLRVLGQDRCRPFFFFIVLFVGACRHRIDTLISSELSVWRYEPQKNGCKGKSAKERYQVSIKPNERGEGAARGET